MVHDTDVKAMPENAGLLALTEKLRQQLEYRQAVENGAVDLDFDADRVNTELIAATDGIVVEFNCEINPMSEQEVHREIQKVLATTGTTWKLIEEIFPTVGYRGVMVLPPAGQVPTIGEAWELARKIGKKRGVRSATPLFAQLAPVIETERMANLFTAGVLTPEAQRSWHMRELKVQVAWQQLRDVGIEPGAGVVVAVADTGYTDHPEIFDRLTKEPQDATKVHGIDLIDGADPRDPLQGGWFFPSPSHGTAVASVVVSSEGPSPGTAPGADFVNGVAPAAQVLPIRMTTSVVLLAPTKLNAALAAAVAANADVINMSLGMPQYTASLHGAVRAAVAKGTILVAASGNVWPFVVYPAALPEVLAAAACGPDLRPWADSSSGEAVDVLAPGHQVQRAFTRLRDGSTVPEYGAAPSSGTTFAAACCTGLAALWLSFHGGRQKLIARYNKQAYRVPQAFHYLVRRTVRLLPGVPANQYGVGLPQADKLLAAPLPSAQELDDDFQELQLWLAAVASPNASPLAGFMLEEDEVAPDVVEGALQDLLGPLLAQSVAVPGADLVSELRFHFASRLELFRLFQDMLRGGPPAVLRRRMIRDKELSETLKAQLESAEHATDGAAPGTQRTTTPQPHAAARRGPGRRAATPLERRLRVYAFDPSLATSADTSKYTEVTVGVRWEALELGPVGEYLEVIDVDPASRTAYEPVNLDDPHVLAVDGLDPSEGDPAFHQQMVYAVAMKTIAHFERALGRPAFWATKPFKDQSGKWHPEPFVQRLRIYPHALRVQNAYYSPQKRALLFGYFRSPSVGNEPTGPTVFTCLSYDIIAHETTHALLDGMYHYYSRAANPDVLAFHEAFADIVALFQHFTHVEILREAITETRGNLQADSPLGKLALQFGQATGRRGALRDAIGQIDQNDNWQRHKPDAKALQRPEYLTSLHARGSILVAAVFDAFLQIYDRRARRVIRLATRGSGVLNPGDLHPDLCTALAEEAVKASGHVLNICIRALDYLPPIDITFGDYLRAIITADHDLVPNDSLGYRIAFAEAFKTWGIYAHGVTSVVPDSLRWEEPSAAAKEFELDPRMRERLTRLLANWRTTRNREALHTATLRAKERMHGLLRQYPALSSEIDMDLSRTFEVHTLRPAASIGPDDEINPLIVVTLTQRPENKDESERVGATLLINIGDGRIRYVIRRPRAAQHSTDMLQRYMELRADDAARRDPYALAALSREPFGALHLAGSL